MLSLGQEVVLDQPVEGRSTEVTLSHTGNHLDVAQSAGTALDVGLEVVDGILELVVALLLLPGLGSEELIRRPQCRRIGCFAHPLVQPTAAVDQSRFHKVGGHSDVCAGLLHALGHGADTVAGVQVGIPQRPDKILQRIIRTLGIVGTEDQQVGI